MLKKTISYTDFNDQSVTKVCYFHLSKSELIEYEMSKPGGAQEWLTKIIEAGDGKTLMQEFKELVLKSYGKRSEDGSGFTKSDDLRQQFYSSQAYDALFSELVTNAEAAAEFVNGILPSNLAEEIQKLAPRHGGPETMPGQGIPPEQQPDTKNVFDENAVRQLTIAEAQEMDDAELKAGLISGRFTLP